MAWQMVLTAVVVVCGSIFAVIVYRFLKIRGTGTPIVIRASLRETLPTLWEHGVVRYTESSAQLYKLLSIRAYRDLELQRASIDLGVGRAPSTPQEHSVLDPGEQIIPFTARDSRGRTIYGEFGMDTRTHAAMRSWVEACSTQAVPRRRRTQF